MLSGEILINEQVQLKIWKVLDLVYLQKLHHIVEQEPVVKYITITTITPCTIHNVKLIELINTTILYVGNRSRQQTLRVVSI